MTEKRGGVRNNSGRNPLPEKKRRLTLSTSISNESMVFLEQLKKKGYAFGHSVDELIAIYKKVKKDYPLNKR